MKAEDPAADADAGTPTPGRRRRDAGGRKVSR
jgi:hypothetical protein